MNEKEFENDDVINLRNKILERKKNDDTNKKSIKENLYIKPFRNYRKFLEYAFIGQISLNYTFWLKDKYHGEIFDCPIKTKKVLTSFAIMLIAVTFVDDFIYILFRKDKDDKVINKFMKYQKKLVVNLKTSSSNMIGMNYQKKDDSIHNNKIEFRTEKKLLENQEKAKMKIHRELKEIEKIQKELRDLIKNVPVQDLSHFEILSKINQNSERKRTLINDLKEYNRNLDKIQMI